LVSLFKETILAYDKKYLKDQETQTQENNIDDDSPSKAPQEQDGMEIESPSNIDTVNNNNDCILLKGTFSQILTINKKRFLSKRK